MDDIHPRTSPFSTSHNLVTLCKLSESTRCNVSDSSLPLLHPPSRHSLPTRSLAHVEINKSAILPTIISIDRTIGSDQLDLQHRPTCCSTPLSSPRSSPSLLLLLPQSPGSPGRVNTSTTTAGRGSTSRELHTNLKARSDLLPRPTMPSEYEDCDALSDNEVHKLTVIIDLPHVAVDSRNLPLTSTPFHRQETVPVICLTCNNLEPMLSGSTA